MGNKKTYFKEIKYLNSVGLSKTIFILFFKFFDLELLEVDSDDQIILSNLFIFENEISIEKIEIKLLTTYLGLNLIEMKLIKVALLKNFILIENTCSGGFIIKNIIQIYLFSYYICSFLFKDIYFSPQSAH